jgi:hypothetical protein
MNKNTRSLMAYALTISMLFNTATDNQNKRVYNSNVNFSNNAFSMHGAAQTILCNPQKKGF